MTTLAWNDLYGRPRAQRFVEGQADVDGVVSGPCRVFEVTVRATAAGLGTIGVYDALTVGGGSNPIIAGSQNNSGTINFGPAGIRFTTGLSLSASANTTQSFVTYMVE